ncbi:YhhN-like protein [Aeromicrobium marinum DSM 15272]|uniref:YhhN-like protein n=1 Tax=Aeromicrobium marinum DSM 15272 TaxID=585531 RepID=E2SBX0_9ACTN|nr:lysoplasmalogenase [Aeromicrobium marinum]EFQ83256.1 YhhN-like protein [Aeromicrobium marinum DSM 15272]
MPDLRSPWWQAFVAVCGIHLVLLAADATPWDSITKCLAAPLLVGWVLAERGPRILAVALTFCLGGDLFLEIESLFVFGMVSFALAHVCFTAWFVSRGALDGLRARPAVPAALVLAAVVLVAVVWGGVDDAVVRYALPFYALLLVGTAATALATDRVAGIGGLLFLVSDAVIALGVADRIDDTAVWAKLTIMVLYFAAIALLTAGATSLPHRAVDSRPNPAAGGISTV